jgi:hypothetical protein
MFQLGELVAIARVDRVAVAEVRLDDTGVPEGLTPIQHLAAHIESLDLG